MNVQHATMLIRINKLYRDDMTDEELYEATRGQWRASPLSHDVEFAMSVYAGEVKEVYSVEAWHPSGTLRYRTRHLEPKDGRWEFEGRPAPEEIRALYVGGSVADYFAPGSANPVRYLNC